ncbi:unnamed protein product [Porites lobata]|uniref:Centromere protein H C-terminal domain-containing protein n=1 Tax=Porites lobata TaxID=104759 RepID=A0ABN8RIE8_9CNID|nr:unnamed protein product [Porites lobata]
MAANSAVEVIEPNMQDEILETTSPIASGRLTLSDTNVAEQAEITNEIVDEVEDAEIDSLLELKKCKEWLLQQKINQQSELLVRNLLKQNIIYRSSADKSEALFNICSLLKQNIIYRSSRDKSEALVNIYSLLKQNIIYRSGRDKSKALVNIYRATQTVTYCHTLSQLGATQTVTYKSWQQFLIKHTLAEPYCRLQQREDLQPSSNESTQSDLYERISKLQDQLYSLSTARSYKKLVLDRLLCGDQLIKKLFPDVVTESPTEEHIEEMKAFARLCEKQNKLSTDILIEHEALLEAQTVLDKVRQQSYEKKKENRGLMKSLQSLKEDQEVASSSRTDNAQIQKLKQQIATKVEKIDIVRNVFQGVIVGSGLDWASDNDMKRLVLSLGEVLEFAA